MLSCRRHARIFLPYIFYNLEQFKFSPTPRWQFHHPHYIFLWKKIKLLEAITGPDKSFTWSLGVLHPKLWHVVPGSTMGPQDASPCSQIRWTRGGKLWLGHKAVCWEGRWNPAVSEASCCWGNQCLYLFCLFNTVAKGTGSIRSSLCQTEGNFSVFFLL